MRELQVTNMGAVQKVRKLSGSGSDAPHRLSMQEAKNLSPFIFDGASRKHQNAFNKKIKQFHQ